MATRVFKGDVKIEADLEVTKTLTIQTPTQDTHAAPKKYVDDRAFTKVRITDANSPYSVPAGREIHIVTKMTTAINIDLPTVSSSNDGNVIEIWNAVTGVTIDAASGQKIRLYGEDLDQANNTNYFYYWCRLTADNTEGKWIGVSS